MSGAPEAPLLVVRPVASADRPAVDAFLAQAAVQRNQGSSASGV